MNAKLLLASLKTQEVNMNQLIESLETQKKAIVNNDYNSLEEAIGKEQLILRKIEQEETSRVKLVRDIGRQYNLNLNSHSLDDLLSKGARYFEEDAKALMTYRKSLKVKIEYILKTNTQLKDVIEFSRNIIKETMMMIAGPTKRALVNKRV